LAAAIRLPVLGLDVHVYGTNSVPGGKAGYIEDEGFRLFFYQRKML
jgi:phytoene dehydrogenase-like protein